MRYLLLIPFFIAATCVGQVIPNADFENWIPGPWLSEPEGWTTPNSELDPVVIQDMDAFQGDYAMRVNAIPDGIGASGWAACTLSTQAIPAGLNFYVKSLCDFGGVSVSIAFFNNDLEVYTESWNSGNTIEEWTFVSIPLDQIEPVMTHAVIRVEAVVGDLVPGEAWISVDSMGFSQSLISEKEEKLRFSMFPNPAIDQVQLNNLPEKAQFRIMDCTGKILKEGIVRNNGATIYLDQFKRGMYLVEVISGEKRATRSLVVQ